ncbi:Appr-1-p processing domain protein [Planoprotostelium fungivorum]|uniref:Appr-1-p processing domain protein n=1 Tax=Planoprotostelium fungivorum TaxID=1890364 RepID=A0A2P6N8B6_9EUKA|nr:recombination factor protein RarA [Planoprotostelium fungivorum]PRP83304.1 Appr-1-p processing domain protein [Planoprotostelium fungivorum]
MSEKNEMKRAITTGVAGFRKPKEDDPTPSTTSITPKRPPNKISLDSDSDDEVLPKKLDKSKTPTGKLQSGSSLQRANSDSIKSVTSQEETQTPPDQTDEKKDRSSSRLIKEHTTDQNKRIQVRHGDITAEDTDAIVNAANGHLAHGAGVAGAITSAGGPSIQKESDQWIKKNGSVPTGEVAVTGPGRMMCRHVIHAVGPIWRDGSRDEENLLEKAVWNSIYKAHEMGLKSISIPAISSGIFGMPKELVANVMFRSALKFSKSYSDSSVEEIRFTNFDQPTVNVFRDRFVALFEKK